MSIKLRGLNLGYIGLDRELLAFPHPKYILHSQKKEGKKSWYDNPVISYVLDSPDGLILFDTGVSDSHTEEWLPEWEWLVDVTGITPDVCLEERLKSIGLAPDDFKYVIIGHLHVDHAGGLRLFREAGVEVIMHADEYKHATSVMAPENFYVPEDWAGLTEAKAPTLLDEETEIVKGVRTISLPGHTPGTMGLVIDLEHTGAVILSSDAIHTHENCGPPPVANVLAMDLARWAQSVEKLQRIAAERNAFVFPGHDETGLQFTGTDFAPKEISFTPNYIYE